MSVPSATAPIEPDYDAARVLVAALVAQQAALDDREAALHERELAIAQQERQLSQRFEDKQRNLDHLHEQLSVAREQFRQERTKQDRMLDEASKIHGEAVTERDRLRELRCKFLRRCKRHWTAERQHWEQKQAALEHTRQAIDRESAALNQDRESARKARQRLGEETRQLADERKQSRAESNRKETELNSLRRLLERKERELSEIERRLQQERPRLEHECESLRAEARGLENRISSARRLLIHQKLQHSPTPLPSAEIVFPPLPQAVEVALAQREDDYRRGQAALQKQVTMLADQRAQLAEMCERLAQAEIDWQAKQIEAVAEMEALAMDLERRERALDEQIHDLTADSERLRQERDQIARRRRELERASAELALRQSAQRGERDRMQTELAEREQLAQRREQALNVLFQRWRERRHVETARVRKLAAQTIKVREVFIEQRDECRHRAESLREAQQALAEQAMALEEARAEFLVETGRPKSTARRIERLRRRWERQSLVAKRELVRQRDALAVEDAELRQVYGELLTDQVKLVQHEQRLAQQLTEAEDEHRRAGDANRQLESARAAWLEERRAYESQISGLRADLAQLADLGELPTRAAA
jgi:hypothetical protein